MIRRHRPFHTLPTRTRFGVFQEAHRALLGAAAVAVATLASSSANAQAISGEFSVQRFDPAVGAHNFFTTRGVRMDGKMVWSAGFLANYAYLPFVVRSCASQTDCNDPAAGRTQKTKVVENLLTGDLMGALTVVPRLQISMRIPLTWVKGLGINDQGTNSTKGINTFGPGDAMVEGKFRLHGEITDPFVVGASAFVTGPLGHLTNKGSYIGDTLPSAGLRAIIDGAKGPLSVGANLAGVLRGSGKVGTTTVGSEARYSVAAGFFVSPVIRLVADVFGATRFSASRGENTAEVDGGLQAIPLGSPVTITVGGGTGLVEGVGVPVLRVFAGVNYSLERRDRDGDGIDDASDQCPTDKEDVDGYEDSDGCPDPDNDLDTVPDAQDKCPDQPEDQDGFEDRDGCPDPDNDKDGIPDVSDQCPNQPETKNGYKDDDGCPDEADRDNDGVPDSRDKCPDEPEDTDGFQDTDGCPDLDNDNDGIPDAEDECIDEPGKAPSGCPDDPKSGKTAPKKGEKK